MSLVRSTDRGTLRRKTDAVAFQQRCALIGVAAISTPPKRIADTQG